jgi:hypothetical protein
MDSMPRSFQEGKKEFEKTCNLTCVHPISVYFPAENDAALGDMKYDILFCATDQLYQGSLLFKNQSLGVKLGLDNCHSQSRDAIRDAVHKSKNPLGPFYIVVGMKQTKVGSSLDTSDKKDDCYLLPVCIISFHVTY